MIIWDFETKGVARASQPHDQAVSCLAWSRDGRHVVSAARDCSVSSLSILDNKLVCSSWLPDMQSLQECLYLLKIVLSCVQWQTWQCPCGKLATQDALTASAAGRVWQGGAFWGARLLHGDFSGRVQFLGAQFAASPSLLHHIFLS